MKPLCLICQKRPQTVDDSRTSDNVKELMCEQCRQALDTLSESIKTLNRAVDILEGK